MTTEADTNLTPECHLCGERVGMFPISAVLSVPGQWMPSIEHDVAVFVLDPDAQLTVIQLPNGQLAFVTGEKPLMHSHSECFEQMSDEYLYPDTAHDDDDDLEPDWSEDY